MTLKKLDRFPSKQPDFFANSTCREYKEKALVEFGDHVLNRSRNFYLAKMTKKAVRQGYRLMCRLLYPRE